MLKIDVIFEISRIFSACRARVTYTIFIQKMCTKVDFVFRFECREYIIAAEFESVCKAFLLHTLLNSARVKYYAHAHHARKLYEKSEDENFTGNSHLSGQFFFIFLTIYE